MKKKLLVTLCTVAALSVSACDSSLKNDGEEGNILAIGTIKGTYTAGD